MPSRASSIASTSCSVSADGADRPASVEDLLAAARSGFTRVDVAELVARIAQGAVVVDIRPVAQRLATGEIPGSLIVERNA